MLPLIVLSPRSLRLTPLVLANLMLLPSPISVPFPITGALDPDLGLKMKVVLLAVAISLTPSSTHVFALCFGTPFSLSPRYLPFPSLLRRLLLFL